MQRTLDLAAAVSEWRAIANQARQLHEDLPAVVRDSIEAGSATVATLAPALAALPKAERCRVISVLEGLADTLEDVLAGQVSVPAPRRCPTHSRSARLGL